MKNRILGVLLIVGLLIGNINILAEAKETPDELNNLYARSAVLMDADSGRILFGKNEKDVLPMASTTKIMTCILTLEHMQEEMISRVSDYAAGQPKVRLGVREGEQYYLRDLLYSLMLESHNDSAVVISETIAGSVQKFADMMNQKAIEIGCRDTYFITPNGLDANDEKGVHSTTAQDLAKIMRYCILQSPEKDKFINITQKLSYEFSDITGSRHFVCRNHNSFLGMMEGVLSGKTGFTNDAGYCYVCALENDNRRFIVALLACGWPNNRSYKWQDTKRIMKYAIKNYTYRNVKKEISLPDISVKNGMDVKNPFKKIRNVGTKMLINSLGTEILMCDKEQVEVKFIQKSTVKAPVQKKQKVGRVFYIIDGVILEDFDVVTIHNIEERTFYKIISEILNNYLIHKL